MKTPDCNHDAMAGFAPAHLLGGVATNCNMTDEPLHDAQRKLRRIIDTMDVPELRRHDIHWLERNLRINNVGHPLLPDALDVLKQMRRMMKARVERPNSVLDRTTPETKERK
jgi:hypothetical protein